VAREASAAASAPPSPTRAQENQTKQMNAMEVEAKNEMAELQQMIAAEEHTLSVLAGERPPTPDYSRVGRLPPLTPA
jgi:hypothetical protein